MSNEQLKRSEQLHNEEQVQPELSPVALDRERIEAAIERRAKKLETVKDFIPLKTYNSILEKLSDERERLNTKLESKQQQIEKENKPQTLPKILFEQHHLKPKHIRIN